MQQLILGNISFYIDEYPDTIEFGGDQTLATRKFPGGGKDIQTLGAFDDEITWSGAFWFRDAIQRCNAIDTMRINGDSVNLQVSSFSRTVIVSKFKFKYYNDFYIEYTITLEPLDEYAGGSSVNGINTSQSALTTTTTVMDSNSSSNSSSTSSSSSTSDQSQSQVVHVMQDGDTLWGLAVKYYGDGTQWPKIADANGISDPTTIPDGLEVTVPDPTQGV
jgi:nucleoid-associated protein YgaU